MQALFQGYYYNKNDNEKLKEDGVTTTGNAKTI